MAKQTDFTKMFADMPNMMDTKTFEDGFKQVADFNERLFGVASEAATKSTDIMTGAAKDTFGNVRTLTAARSKPEDYAQVFSDFAQAQMELTQRTTQAFADLAQHTGGQFTEVTQKAGDKTAQKAANTAKTASKAA